VFFLIVFTSCNTTKYVPENQRLLSANTVVIDGKETSESEIYDYIVQRPNSKILGFPLGLNIYNYGDPEFEDNYEKWVLNHPKTSGFISDMFSEKQTVVVYNTHKAFNEWYLKKGQPPVLFSEVKTAKTLKSFQDYFFTQGYFDAHVIYQLDSSKAKETEVIYKVTTNKRYRIDTINIDIASPVLDSIYKKHQKKSLLAKGDPFVFETFEKEKNRLNTLFKNSGIYHFNPGTIGYWTDSLDLPKDKFITLKIPERVVSAGDSVSFKPYKVQRFKDVKVYIDFESKKAKDTALDSASYEGITYYSPKKLNYKPKRLDDALFIYPDSIFRLNDVNLTLSHLRKTQNFKAAMNIDLIEKDDESLDAEIYLKSNKKYAITFDLDATTSNTKPFGILGKASFIDRNVFKGTEIFEVSFQGSLLNVSQDAGVEASGFFNAWEFLANTSLSIPRIFFPLNTEKLITKEMTPVTKFDLTLGTQKNIGLDRITVTSNMMYAWQSTPRLGHKIELFNFQYIKNQNIDNYFMVYNSEYEKLNEVSESLFDETLLQDNDEILAFMDEILDPANGYEQTNLEEYNTVSDVDELREILIEDVLVPVISYTANYSTKENLSDQDFYFLSARIVSAGNLSTAIAPSTNEEGQKTMFGLPIAQYLRTEFEFKRYWNPYGSNVFVWRNFLGIAIPYGNSTNIPFSRSYSAGGSNDIRAWQTYDLGPGGELNYLEYKVGTLKIVSSFEYRFKVFDNIYSALFVDAGNIWDITNSNLVTEEGKFTEFASLKNIALGSGFGLRYDFDFLIFRFDIGFKTYEPYLADEKKWLTNYNFGNAVYNIGINYPF